MARRFSIVPAAGGGLTRRVIDRELIFRGSIFDVERDRISCENGQEFIREVVRHPGGAGGLPILSDGRVALVRQYRHPAGRELLEIPAGRIEGNETPEACAAREIEQEVGYRPGRLEKIAQFYSTPGFCEEQLFVYLATELTLVGQQLDLDEHLDIVYVPLGEALSMAERGEIEDSKTLVALLFARRLLNI